jgi:hypothetical protein
LRSITNRHADFFEVTEDALVYTANASKLELPPETPKRLLDAYLTLKPWPDAVDAPRKLKASGVRIITISNFSPKMLRSYADNAEISDLFDELLSTEVNGTVSARENQSCQGGYPVGLVPFHQPRSQLMARPKDPNLERVWRQRLQRQSTRGLSISAFGALEGVSSTSFQAWKRRLTARSLPARPQQPLFVPLQLEPHPPEAGRAPSQGVELELPHPIRLRFDSPPEPEWLGRVVAALAGLPRQEATP